MNNKTKNSMDGSDDEHLLTTDLEINNHLEIEDNVLYNPLDATSVVIFLLFLIGFLIFCAPVTIPTLQYVSYANETHISTSLYGYGPKNDQCACNGSNTKIFNLGIQKSGTKSLNNSVHY
eukprot:964021_1